MEYGLIGKKLGHSFSKEIHEYLADYTYELKEVNEEEVKSLLNKTLKGMNVTIPYKQMIIPMLDHVDESALKINSVNTVVQKDGKFIGYNTDYLGFIAMLKKHEMHVENANVLVLGSGATSKTVVAALEYLNAKHIQIVSREAKDDILSYDQLDGCLNYDFIINTTPIGMYPNVDDCLVDLSLFSNLKGVVDVVYNPLTTKLLMQAKKMNIKYAGGLYMLVAQAKYACELFSGVCIENHKIDEIYESILKRMCNVVLVGMPYSGKSSIAKQLKNKLDKVVVDTDSLIEEKECKSIPEIFNDTSESYFRNVECEVVKEVSKGKSQIIATGGGVVLNDSNVDYLNMNSIVIYIKRDLGLVKPNDSRPLTKNRAQLNLLYKQRKSLYENACDIVVENNYTKSSCVDEILEVLDETIRNKWS